MSHHFGCARAYAMLTRVVFFPYAEQIEEAHMRSPYAALSSKWGFCLRQTRCDKAVTKIVKGGFQNGSTVSPGAVAGPNTTNMSSVCWISWILVSQQPRLFKEIFVLQLGADPSWASRFWNVHNTCDQDLSMPKVPKHATPVSISH